MNQHRDRESSKSLLPLGAVHPGHSVCELLQAFGMQRGFFLLSLSPEGKEWNRAAQFCGTKPQREALCLSGHRLPAGQPLRPIAGPGAAPCAGQGPAPGTAGRRARAEFQQGRFVSAAHTPHRSERSSCDRDSCYKYDITSF